jgi:ATP adenylyltransferase
MCGQRLWAPWRLDYIRGPKPEECIFCSQPRLGNDEDALIVHRGERCFVMLNTFPYNNGHLMVSPFEHLRSIGDLDDAVLLELMRLTQRSLRAIREAYGAEGFNIGINDGKVAGAGVEDHLHLHVVPRWEADTNFMSVIGSTRVLPQSLKESYAELRSAFG